MELAAPQDGGGGWGEMAGPSVGEFAGGDAPLCPHCTVAVESSWRFCDSCGGALPTTADDAGAVGGRVEAAAAEAAALPPSMNGEEFGHDAIPQPPSVDMAASAFQLPQILSTPESSRAVDMKAYMEKSKAAYRTAVPFGRGSKQRRTGRKRGRSSAGAGGAGGGGGASGVSASMDDPLTSNMAGGRGVARLQRTNSDSIASAKSITDDEAEMSTTLLSARGREREFADALNAVRKERAIMNSRLSRQERMVSLLEMDNMLKREQELQVRPRFAVQPIEETSGKQQQPATIAAAVAAAAATIDTIPP